jgi:hypothetical protein
LRPIATVISSTRWKSISQTGKAFLEPPREIVLPALGTQASPLSDLLHGHSLDQDIVHQRRSVRAKLALGAVEPQHRLALPFGDRLAPLHAIAIFAGGIDRLRPLPESFWKARPP